MSFQGNIEANCPSCTDGFEAPVWSFVHGGTDVALRDQIKARECNLLLCPSCGAAFMPEVSWIYYEPDAEILGFVFPEAWRAEEATWREKMKIDYAQMRTVLGKTLPADLEPEIYFGQDGLGELLDKDDWRVDERDVMLEYAKELGLSVYRASPLWARTHGAPAEFPYKGKGAPTRAALIEGMKALIKANDALTGWSDFLARFEKDPSAALPARREEAVKAEAATVPVPAAAARFLKPLADEARKRNLPLYVVGGPVRDWLLGRSTFDLDLTVVGEPDPVASLCARLVGGKVEPFGRFGTRRVIGKGRFRVDVATTRVEKYAEPAALPEVTATGVPIEQDLFRRDFTINAMALRLDDGSRLLVDPYGGLRDLKSRTLRVLHPASFRDDPTRVFRAARFLARLRGKPADGMGGEAKDVLKMGEAAKLSRHRLLHELLCLLGEKNPGLAFGLLEMWGYLGLLHPELPWRGPLPDGVFPRLAAMSVALGPVKGKDFVDSFPFEHHLRIGLLETLALAFSDKAPRALPPAPVAAAVRRAFPRLSSAALKPCFVGGVDLIALGRKPGPEFQPVLDEAARLQRLGKLKTRASALAFLKKQEKP